MELSGRRVAVVGLGRSGLSAARLCTRRGARVTGLDERPAAQLGVDAGACAALLSGRPRPFDLRDFDVVVVSPGVPGGEDLDAAERAGAEVIGETELAARHLVAPVLAIGGTNGKSTVTTLVGAMATEAGLRTFVGGNLGTPACEAAAGEHDVVVLEVSSFQMERVVEFRPRVATVLNLSADHLDRYASLEAYRAAKGNAFRRQGPGDVAVVPDGDAALAAEARRGGGRLVTFGASGGDFALDGRVVREGELAHDLAGAPLFGRHNLLNATAAIAVARSFGLAPEAVRAALERFAPLPHRMSLVATLGGVRYFDDSKGTNVGAAVAALEGLEEERAVLIAGGRDKGGSYEPLVEVLRQRGRAVVVLGEAAERIRRAIGDLLPVEVARDLEQAVALARGLARPGDAVLLSPACSSFDMFRDYAERGERFASAVTALQAGEAGALPADRRAP